MTSLPGKDALVLAHSATFSHLILYRSTTFAPFVTIGFGRVQKVALELHRARNQSFFGTLLNSTKKAGSLHTIWGTV